MLVPLDDQLTINQSLVLPLPHQRILHEEHLLLHLTNFSGLAAREEMVRNDQAVEVMADSHYDLFRIFALVSEVVKAAGPIRLTLIN